MFPQKIIFLFPVCLVFFIVSSGQPRISSFTPKSGAVGTTVIISGNNFSLNPLDNVVYFGGVKANVVASSSTSLSVSVPSGATFQPISVTVNGLTAFSSTPFIVSFPGGVLTRNSFSFVDTLANLENVETNNNTSADFDGDGKIDLAIVDRTDNKLFVYKNNSTVSTISFASEIVYGVGTQPSKVVTGDVDGDGKIDIVCANKGDNTVSVFRNTSVPGTISFASKLDFVTDDGPLDVALGDFNGDGRLDIVTVNNASLPSYVSILQNTGSQGSISFGTKLRINLTFPATHINVADLNGDSKVDIVLISISTNTLSFLTNISSGSAISFFSPVTQNTGTTPGDIAVADLDGDTKPDITVTNFSSNTISIYRNTSIGTTTSFASKNDWSVTGADHVTIFDADGDGKVDIAVQTFSPSGFTIIKNNSSPGAISPGFNADFVEGCSMGILAADWNGDGRSDIAITCPALRAIFWKNRTTEPQITFFTPSSAATGQTVTISGANFNGVTSVLFGGTPASSFTVVNSTTITAVVAGGASGPIEVISPAGNSIRPGFTYIGPPVISSFSPTTGTNGTTVTIKGANFNGATAVSFGGVAATNFTITDLGTTITATVGNGSSGNVSVTTPYGSASLAGFTHTSPAPTITSFTPTSGGPGATISINGTNFTGATSVSFGGVMASSFTVINANLITAVVATGASGDIRVSTPSGSAVRSGFIYLPPPLIVSFSPPSGKTGAIITIKGSNLSNVTSVTFGGVLASSINIVDATQITAMVGNGASGDVEVKSANGTSKLSGFIFLPPPTVDSFSPTSGAIGSTVIINGTNFTGATNVYFNGQPAASFTVLSSTSISAVTGAGNTGSIQVITPNGSAVSSSYFSFIYPQPAITSFTPTSATTGSVVTINGTNFVAVGSVEFGGVPASSFVVNSSSRITATVAAGATGNIVIKTGGGVATLPGFTFLQPPPTITTFYPAYAGVDGSVSITGTNFTNTTSVTFGGISATSFVVNSPTSITAVVGTGATGQVKVTTPGGTASSVYSLTYENPIITSFSPMFGGAGTAITILGSGFENVSSVKIGGVPVASYQVISSGMITAVVGSGNSGDVTVSIQTITARAGSFIYNAPKTSIVSVVPAFGSSGSTIKISGYKFTGATGVSFGGMPASSFDVKSDTVIIAVVASGTSGDVTVTTPNGSASQPGFIYSTAPIITSVAPGAASVGSAVTISGFNFSATPSGNIVYFGSVRASVLSAANNNIVVAVPVGATYQPITVTSNGRTAISARAFNVLFSSLGNLSTNSFIRTNDSAGWNKPVDVCIADIDVDGRSDIVAAIDYPDNKAVVFRNQSRPDSIGLSPKKIINGTRDPRQCLFSDLDGDGLLDLIVSNYVDANGVSIFRNTSTPGTVSFANEYLISNLRLSNFYVAAGDLDGDGKIDLAVASQYSNEISIYKNNGNVGTISLASPVKLALAGMPTEIQISDVDGDGKSDLIISTAVGTIGFNGKLYIYRNTCSATAISFDSPKAFTISGYLNSLGVADLDGDNKVDVVVGNVYINTISIFRNISTPGVIELGNKIELLAALNPCHVSTTDLDGDGKPDLIISNNTFDSVSHSVFKNISSTGSIAFAKRFDLYTGGNPFATAIGDIDGDGRPDIVSANNSAGSISVLKNLVDGYFVRSFTPASGTSGSVITIKGTHFNQAKSVSFGGKPALSFSIVNDSTLTAVIGEGGTGSVSVTFASVTASLPGFTYVVPAPVVTSFIPVVAGSGASVTITGVNFIGVTNVDFGGVPAQSFTVNSSTSVTAIVGGGATGSVSVTASGGTASLPGFTFSVATSVGTPVNVNSKDLEINPNPASGLIVVKHPLISKNSEIVIIDIYGRMVKKMVLKYNTKQTEINVSDMNSGIYQVIWSDGKRVLSKSLMVIPD